LEPAIKDVGRKNGGHEVEGCPLFFCLTPVNGRINDQSLRELNL
jgi:hypothetical protein